jgi:hypothetical protein
LVEAVGAGGEASWSEMADRPPAGAAIPIGIRMGKLENQERATLGIKEEGGVDSKSNAGSEDGG